MFKRLFRYFYRSSKTSKNYNSEESCAVISLIVKKQQKHPTIDILINDYSDESIDGLICIISAIQNQYCAMEIVKIVTENLQTHGREQDLVNFLIKIGTMAEKNAKQTQGEHFKDCKQDPCIKPSDMLK